MGLITLPGAGLWIPSGMGTHRQVSPVVGNFGTIADADDKVAHIFRAPRTGTLELFEFLLAGVTTFPATGIRFSWQNVGADGFPDGVVDQFAVRAASLASNAWAVPDNAITDDGTGSGVKRSVTRGDLIAAVIDINPTFSTGSFQSNFFSTSELTGPQLFPYSAAFSTSWAKVASCYPIVAIKYSDGTYVSLGPQLWPFNANGSTTTYGNGSTPDEVALRFKVPFEGTLAGGWVNVLAAGDFDIVLYDSDDEVVTSVSFVNDQLQDIATAKKLFFSFPTPATLTANAVYRLSIKPTSATTISVYHIVAQSNDMLGAMPGGKEFYKSTQTDGAGWSDQDTEVPMMGLQFTEIHESGPVSPIALAVSDGLR